MSELKQEMIVQTNDIFTKKLSLKTLLRMNSEGIAFTRSPKQKLPYLKAGDIVVWCGKTVKGAISKIEDDQLKDWFLKNINDLELGLLQKSNNWVIYIKNDGSETVFSFTTEDIKGITESAPVAIIK